MAEGLRHVGPKTIAGPTTGGVILAYEVARQLGLRSVMAERKEDGPGRIIGRDFHLERGERVLVVDDVLTTGGSLRETIDAVREAGGEPVGVAVMVDRARGQTDFGLPFFAATEVEMQTFDPSDCPLCRNGLPLKIT